MCWTILSLSELVRELPSSVDMGVRQVPDRCTGCEQQEPNWISPKDPCIELRLGSDCGSPFKQTRMEERASPLFYTRPTGRAADRAPGAA